MKLHPVQRKLGMGHPHDDPVRRMGGQVQGGVRGRLHRQGMIPGGPKGRGNPLKKALIPVMHPAGFSVHRDRGPHRAAAEYFIDALHPQADPQGRGVPAKGLNQVHRNSRMDRVFGSGADQNVIRPEIFCLFHGNFITPEHPDMEGIMPEHLNQIVSERIVIVDDQKCCHAALPNKKSRPDESGWPSPRA